MFDTPIYSSEEQEKLAREYEEQEFAILVVKGHLTRDEFKTLTGKSFEDYLKEIEEIDDDPVQ